MPRTSRMFLKRGALLAAAMLLVPLLAPTAASGEASPMDPLVGLNDQVSQYNPADYTAESWATFSSARDTAAALVQRGSGVSAERAAAREEL